MLYRPNFCVHRIFARRSLPSWSQLGFVGGSPKLQREVFSTGFWWLEWLEWRFGEEPYPCPCPVPADAFLGYGRLGCNLCWTLFDLVSHYAKDFYVRRFVVPAWQDWQDWTCFLVPQRRSGEEPPLANTLSARNEKEPGKDLTRLI